MKFYVLGMINAKKQIDKINIDNFTKVNFRIIEMKNVISIILLDSDG
jgi:hypothetical protein